MGNWDEPLTFTVNGKEVSTPEEAAAASKGDDDDDKPKPPVIPTHDTHPA